VFLFVEKEKVSVVYLLRGGKPRNNREMDVLDKIIRLDLLGLGFDNNEINVMSLEDVNDYLSIVRARRDMERREI